MCPLVGVSILTDSRVPSRWAASTYWYSAPGITFMWMYPLNPYLLRTASTTLTRRSVVLEPSPAMPELRNRPLTVCRRWSSMKVRASSSTLKAYRFLGHPVAVGAVRAVHLAEVGEHDPHEVDELTVGHGGAVHAVGGVLLGRGIGATAVAASFGRRQDVVRRHSSEYPELVVCVGRLLYEHGLSPCAGTPVLAREPMFTH